MTEDPPPELFVNALMSLRTVATDPSFPFTETAAPTKLAPYAAALKVLAIPPGSDRPVATSTMVILFDEEQEENWGGPFRLVGHARMQIDADQSTDPVLGEAIWNTLADGLDSAGAGYSRLVGSVTSEITQTFGGLELRASALNADLRCSWSPNTGELGEHLAGWIEALRQNCGMEPAGVITLGSKYG